MTPSEWKTICRHGSGNADEGIIQEKLVWNKARIYGLRQTKANKVKCGRNSGYIILDYEHYLHTN